MNKIKYIVGIVLIVITVLAVVSYVSEVRSNKDLKKEFDFYNNKTVELAIKNDSLNDVVAYLSDSIVKNELEVKELNISELKHKETAQYYRSKYKEILEMTPETVQDSLIVSNEKVVALLGENKALGDGLKVCDTAKTIQHQTIKDLKLVILNKDFIIENQQGIIDLRNRQIRLLEESVKKQKKKRVKAFVQGAVSGLLLGVLILM